MKFPAKKITALVALIFITGLLVAPHALTAPRASQKASPKAPAGAAAKIGIVDMQRILRESKAATAARNSLLKDMEGKRKQIEAKAKTVQTLEQEIAKLPPTTPQEQQRQKADQLKHEVRELTNLRQDIEMEIKNKDQEMARKIFGEVMQIIRNYARTERFNLIMERSTIVMAEENLDITERILKIYDSQKK